MSDHDDLPIGRVLSRRDILRLAAMTGAGQVFPSIRAKDFNVPSLSDAV